MRLLLTTVFLVAATSCGSSTPSIPDAGVVIDAGLADAGTVDAGVDAGITPDAGIPDAGVVPDAGLVPDAGVDDRVYPAPDFSRRVPSTLQEPTLGVSIFFSPTEDTKALVLGELERTQSKLRVAMFNIREASVVEKMLQMSQSGIDVEVLFDKKQADLDYNTMDDVLADGGVPLQRVEVTGANDATLHDKLAIFDDGRVLTGSANWSFTGFSQNYEHFLLIEGGAWPGVYSTEYEEIKTGVKAMGTYDSQAAMNVVFSPEDRLDLTIKARIDAASSRILVAMFDLTSMDLTNALVDAAQRGVTAIFVIDQEMATANVLVDQLKNAGVIVVEVNLAIPPNSAAKMHDKLCVIDDEIVFAGSFNWTNLATYFNQENLVEMRSRRIAARVTGRMLEILLLHDPNYTNPVSPPAAYKMTAGDVTVTFEVRAPALRSGDRLFVGGDASVLGAWERGRAVAMTDRGDGWWSADLTLPAGKVVEYKYLIQNHLGDRNWEGGPKHYYLPVFSVSPQRWSTSYLGPPTP